MTRRDQIRRRGLFQASQRLILDHIQSCACETAFAQGGEDDGEEPIDEDDELSDDDDEGGSSPLN